jgi:phenylacetate-CoA ligase
MQGFFKKCYRRSVAVATVTEPCACGRGLARIVNIQGRERDFILTPAGRKVHGAFFNQFAPFYEATWLERYQVHQGDRDHLEIRVIVNRQPSAAETGGMIDALVRGLGEMKISINVVEDLELTATGKFRVVTSALQAFSPSRLPGGRPT